MKRSGIKPSAKPMARGAGFKRAAPSKKVPDMAPKRMKSRGPRMTPIRKSAKGEDCTMLILGVCNHDPATVVLCHSNSLADGKGMGLKAPDTAACYGCSACHDVLDGRRPRPEWMTQLVLLAVFERAVTITHEKLKQKGLL